MKKMKSFRLSEQCRASLSAIQSLNDEWTETEIIEKAVDLLYHVELDTEDFNKLKYRSIGGVLLYIYPTDFYRGV